MNMYLERIESGAGRNQYALYRHFGLKTWRTTALGLTCRGMLVDPTDGHLFTVQDGTIYDLLSDGTVNRSYAISSDGDLVSMDESRNSLFVVSNNILYRVNAAAVTTPTLPFVPSAVAVIGGYVVALQANTTTFYFSSNDGATWPALNFQNSEAYPNSLVNIITDHTELWVFGNRRTQVYVVGDDPSAPLVALSAGVIEMGLSAKRAVVKMDNSIFWLGQNRDGENMVWRANGYTPVRISTHAVENAFRGYGFYANATMQSLQINGHSCLRLTFPSANNGLGATWEYDASLPTEMAWREVAWWNTELGRFERHRGNCYASAFGKILVGDHSNGFIYEMGPDFYSDFGYPLRYERRAPHVTRENKFIRYKNFEVVAQTGVGLTGAAWLHTYDRPRATFVTDLQAQVDAGNVTTAQQTALQAIFDRDPYNQDLALPGTDSVLTGLGFYEWGRNPQLGMRYSNDGGENWNAITYRDLGRAGNFNKRLKWWYLGKGRDRVWEVSGDAPVKTAIVQGIFDADVCLS